MRGRCCGVVDGVCSDGASLDRRLVVEWTGEQAEHNGGIGTAAVSLQHFGHVATAGCPEGTENLLHFRLGPGTQCPDQGGSVAVEVIGQLLRHRHQIAVETAGLRLSEAGTDLVREVRDDPCRRAPATVDRRPMHTRPCGYQLDAHPRRSLLDEQCARGRQDGLTSAGGSAAGAHATYRGVIHTDQLNATNRCVSLQP